jgi:hypothetical protein
LRDTFSSTLAVTPRKAESFLFFLFLGLPHLILQIPRREEERTTLTHIRHDSFLPFTSLFFLFRVIYDESEERGKLAPQDSQSSSEACTAEVTEFTVPCAAFLSLFFRGHTQHQQQQQKKYEGKKNSAKKSILGCVEAAREEKRERKT